MANHLIVHLSPEERRLLLRLAKTDVRPPHDQIRYLIVNEAQRRGILPTNNNTGAIRQDSHAGVVEVAR